MNRAIQTAQTIQPVRVLGIDWGSVTINKANSIKAHLPPRLSPHSHAVMYVTFHDLRHNFAHRAREAGWTLDEVAYYLGHIIKKGTPAIQTTVWYTQSSP